jgi:hypothetical protein
LNRLLLSSILKQNRLTDGSRYQRISRSSPGPSRIWGASLRVADQRDRIGTAPRLPWTRKHVTGTNAMRDSL